MKILNKLAWVLSLGFLIIGGAGSVSPSEGISKQSAFDENGRLKGPYDLYASKAAFEAAKKADDRILVQTHDELDEKVLASLGFASLESLGGENGWSLAHLQNENASTAVEKARKSGLFQSVDYDYEYQSDAIDYEPIAGNPSKDDEYWLNQCGIVDAWKYMAANGGTAGGTSNTVVAVIDTGVDYNHEDLKANMWVNTKEIPNNGIDDDKNGYVDDYYGANCVANNGNPMDDMGHGTHVAGLIAGANNSLGMVGVAYNCKIMAIKAGNSSGNFLNSDIAKALNYAYSMGADVINMSFGGAATTSAVQDALETAYSRAALVASAGNDARPNEYINEAPLPEMIYPASFSFVLGVMSESASGSESAFTNVDACPDNSIEYDVYSPGEQMISSLPNNKYAKWSGTSMAAPVVSGVAALLRSQYPDRDVYPTKYLMSQIVEASSNEIHCIHNYSHNTQPHGVNANDVFTKIPKPSVSLYQYYAFDDKAIAEANDGDGIIDSGETINFGVELQNKGGMAKDVKATIDVNRAGGVADSMVSLGTSSVDYGPIGTYSILGNGLTRDANHNITSIEHPFSVVLNKSCPNNYLCAINLNVSWANGLDTNDTTTYSGTFLMQITVHHGVILPSLISTDTTLKEGELYIIANNVVIEKDVTLTIEPGVTVQWYADSNSYYQTDVSERDTIKMYCNGMINAVGTPEKPIKFCVSELYAFDHLAYLQMKRPNGTNNLDTFQYCELENIAFHAEQYAFSTYESRYIVSYDHCRFSASAHNRLFDAIIQAASIAHCQFVNFYPYYCLINTSIFLNNFVDAGSAYGANGFQLQCLVSCQNNVFCATVDTVRGLKIVLGEVSVSNEHYNANAARYTTSISPCIFNNNAFIAQPSVRSLKQWFSLKSEITTYYDINDILQDRIYLKNTYWDQIPSSLIDTLITDYKDDGSSALIDYTTYTGTNDFSVMWPFVKNIHMEDADGNTITTVSTDKVKVVVDFNRDMDTTQDLHVGFGSTDPYNDYIVSGSFASSTQWVGNYQFKTTIENGDQLWYVENGRSSDDHYKTLFTDKMRFGFKIDTTAAQSMALNAVSDITGVTLSWTQDDYTTLAGYNVYRSTTKNGTYAKINAVLIPFDVVTYKDTGVLPGKTYFYYFTVVLTDFTESLPSGATSVTTYDSQAPSLYHTAVTEAYAGSNLVITATITDNVGITSATLYYRVKGTTDWQSTSMTHLNSAYSGIIDASYITSAGLEYYISATDGINVVTSGTPEAPHFVTYKSGVTQNQKGDVDGDGMITVKDALMVLKSINGDLTLTTDQTTRGDVDNDGTLTAADALAILQYANGTITSF